MMEEVERPGNEIQYEEEQFDTITTEESDTKIEYEKEIGGNRPSKRTREEGESDDEWKIAGQAGKGKRIRQYGNSDGETSELEVTISCNEKLPKSFALAKLFKSHNINNIVKVKYLSQFRVRIQIEDKTNLSKLSSCEAFIAMGWRFNKDMEVSYSYGIIRDVDLDLDETELLKSISCHETAKLIAVKRLDRRSKNNDDGWCPSEVIRLCFRGSVLPPYVYTEGLRLKVEPYVYRVSQCSNCWRMGHTKKICSVNKTVCPKCSANHSNCETKTFKCVNCHGKHMALSKSCPVYLKEKRLREIMSEFNCTYKRALTMYVAPSPVRIFDEFKQGVTQSNYAYSEENTYANVTKVYADLHQEEETPLHQTETHQYTSHKKTPKKKQMQNDQRSSKYGHRMGYTSDAQRDEETDSSDIQPNSKSYSKSKITFNELLSRIKEVIFMRKSSLNNKIKNIFKLCIEWVILLVVDNVSDSPMLELFIKLLNG